MTGIFDSDVDVKVLTDSGTVRGVVLVHVSSPRSPSRSRRRRARFAGTTAAGYWKPTTFRVPR